MRQPTWHKSSYSSEDGNCVEAADLDGGQHAVRDSKDPAGPVLTCNATEWAAFTASIRADDFAWRPCRRPAPPAASTAAGDPHQGHLRRCREKPTSMTWI